MGFISLTATGFVGALHTYIMGLEMFFWTSPRGLKSFGLTPERAQMTKVMAANQGLYNGFLAAGLFWGLVQPIPEFAQQIRLFFLGCVLAAGLYGGATANPKIYFIQAVPATISIAIELLGL